MFSFRKRRSIDYYDRLSYHNFLYKIPLKTSFYDPTLQKLQINNNKKLRTEDRVLLQNQQQPAIFSRVQFKEKQKNGQRELTRHKNNP